MWLRERYTSQTFNEWNFPYHFEVKNRLWVNTDGEPAPRKFVETNCQNAKMKFIRSLPNQPEWFRSLDSAKAGGPTWGRCISHKIKLMSETDELVAKIINKNKWFRLRQICVLYYKMRLTSYWPCVPTTLVISMRLTNNVHD